MNSIGKVATLITACRSRQGPIQRAFISNWASASPNFVPSQGLFRRWLECPFTHFTSTDATNSNRCHKASSSAASPACLTDIMLSFSSCTTYILSVRVQMCHSYRLVYLQNHTEALNRGLQCCLNVAGFVSHLPYHRRFNVRVRSKHHSRKTPHLMSGAAVRDHLKNWRGYLLISRENSPWRRVIRFLNREVSMREEVETIAHLKQLPCHEIFSIRVLTRRKPALHIQPPWPKFCPGLPVLNIVTPKQRLPWLADPFPGCAWGSCDSLLPAHRAQPNKERLRRYLAGVFVSTPLPRV